MPPKRRSKRLAAAKFDPKKDIQVQTTEQTDSSENETRERVSSVYSDSSELDTSGEVLGDSRVRQIFAEESVRTPSSPRVSTVQKRSKHKEPQIIHSESDNFHPQASSSRVTPGRITNTPRSSRIIQRRETSSSSDSSDNIRPSEYSARPRQGPSTSQAQSPARTRAESRGRKQSRPKKRTNNVIREIIHYQHNIGLLIPRLPFCRVVREYLLSSYHGDGSDLRISPDALSALQEASEMFLTQLFEDSYRCAVHRDRITLMPKDMQLALLLKNFRI